MSETDRRFGLTVEGFIAAIVPSARIASSRPDAWRWWVFRDGRWSSTDPALVGDEVADSTTIGEVAGRAKAVRFILAMSSAWPNVPGARPGTFDFCSE